MEKGHKITITSLLLVITIIWGVVEIPPAIQNNIQIFSSGFAPTNALSLTSYQSALVHCNFYENVFAQYTDGSKEIVGTNWSYTANPLIGLSIINPTAPTKIITSFQVVLQSSCYNIPSYVTQTIVSGSMPVYAQVSGYDGLQHVLLSGSVPVNIPIQSIVNNQVLTLYSYYIAAGQISQYNNQIGTVTPFTLKLYVNPTLNYVSTLSDGTIQKSTWSNWVTQFFTGSASNVPAPNPTPTPSPTPSQSGGTITPPSSTLAGTTIATGSVKFFYSLLFTGDPALYCGTAVPAPSGGCVVNPTSGPLTVNLNALNVVGSTKGTINSLQTLSIEPVMTPSIRGLNLDSSTSIVYTGSLSIDGKTIVLPSSAISSDQKAFVDSSGNFRFPTASINPVTIDQILKQNGIQPATPDDLIIRIFATGKFSGTNVNGQFQGVLNSPYIDITVWYLSNTPAPTPTPAPTGTPNNPNCTFGTNPDGSCVSSPNQCANGLSGANCQGPPPTPSPTGQPTCTSPQVLVLNGQTYSCIIPPTNVPPSPPPTTPPNNCVNLSAGGVCNDPPPNPTTTPPSSGGPSGVSFVDPNNPPSTGSPNPSGTCTGANCSNFFTQNGLGTGLDVNTMLVIIATAVIVIAIIVVVIRSRNG